MVSYATLNLDSSLFNQSMTQYGAGRILKTKLRGKGLCNYVSHKVTKSCLLFQIY